MTLLRSKPKENCYICGLQKLFNDSILLDSEKEIWLFFDGDQIILSFKHVDDMIEFIIENDIQNYQLDIDERVQFYLDEIEKLKFLKKEIINKFNNFKK